MQTFPVERTVVRSVVAAGFRGAQGPPGPDGTDLIVYQAGSVLGGHRVVCVSNDRVYYADASDVSSAERVIGVTTQAVELLADVIVRRAGIMDEPTWEWVPGPVYLGAAGLMTQVAPTSGVWLQVGVALSATRLDVRIGDAIELV